jgi:hypothetical protein
LDNRHHASRPRYRGSLPFVENELIVPGEQNEPASRFFVLCTLFFIVLDL